MVEQRPPLDLAFAALADPTRRAILERLARRGPATVGELAEPFEMSLAGVSKHIGVLERGGLVRREVRGRSHVLSFDGGPLKRAGRWIDRTERFWSDALDRLEAHLAAAERAAADTTTRRGATRRRTT